MIPLRNEERSTGMARRRRIASCDYVRTDSYELYGGWLFFLRLTIPGSRHSLNSIWTDSLVYFFCVMWGFVLIVMYIMIYRNS